MYSELSWPLDIAPNAQNIGLLAVQTSTPRNPDSVLPPLKTPATDLNPYFQPSAADEHPQVWHYQRNEHEGNQQLEAHPNQFVPQPHTWPGNDAENNCIPDDTVTQADLDRDDDDKTQYFYLDHEGRENFAIAEGYGVDMQSRYTEEYNGQIVLDQGTHAVRTGPMEHDSQNQMFTFAQPQLNEYGQVFSEHQWNQQQMYALEQQDVTDATQLQTADECYYDNVQVHCPRSGDRTAVNTAGQAQWSATATSAHIVSSAAQLDYMSVGTSPAFQNNMSSAWPRTHATVSPSTQPSGRSPTKITSKGDGDFGGYRVQYRQPERDQFHMVSASGDGHQKVTAEQTDTETAAAMTLPERLQQAFLQPGKWSPQLCSCSRYCLAGHRIGHILYFYSPYVFGKDVCLLLISEPCMISYCDEMSVSYFYKRGLK